MYLEKYKESLKRLIQSDGKLVLPKGHEHEAQIVVPDYIVKFCIHYFQLVGADCEVIDPLCGLGTIPRVIKEQGGRCLGVELDEIRYTTAVQLAGEESIIKGDFLTVPLIKNSFDCIFTSLPFAWFRDEETFLHLSPVYAQRFHDLLKKKGIVLLDSIPFVEREGSKWSVAERQCVYLEQNGFELKKILSFDNAQHVDINGLSVIMMFGLSK